MEQQKYLIDSNAVIDYLSNKFPANGMKFMNGVIDAVPALSVITKIEVLGFNTPDEHYTLLTSFINDATVIDLSPAVVNQSIDLRKSFKIKLPDAIIAATALVYDLILITRNTKDFEGISNLQLINPHLST